MRSLLAWTVLFMLVSGRSEARTWRVVADGTGDTSTIQEALDLCAVGDSVSVLPGTYFENLVIAKPSRCARPAERKSPELMETNLAG